MMMAAARRTVAVAGGATGQSTRTATGAARSSAAPLRPRTGSSFEHATLCHRPRHLRSQQQVSRNNRRTAVRLPSPSPPHHQAIIIPLRRRHRRRLPDGSCSANGATTAASNRTGGSSRKRKWRRRGRHHHTQLLMMLLLVPTRSIFLLLMGAKPPLLLPFDRSREAWSTTTLRSTPAPSSALSPKHPSRRVRCSSTCRKSTNNNCSNNNNNIAIVILCLLHSPARPEATTKKRWKSETTPQSSPQRTRTRRSSPSKNTK